VVAHLVPMLENFLHSQFTNVPYTLDVDHSRPFKPGRMFMSTVRAKPCEAPFRFNLVG
jgi:hypothetical protein